MKFFVSINKLLTGFILFFSLLGIYDMYLLRYWLERRFLDRFKIVFVLRDDVQQEDILQSIKNRCNFLKIKEITYLDKNQIYEMVIKNEEMKVLLSVIKTNPFRDVIIVRFENFVEEELKRLISLKGLIPEIKEIIYDYNIKAYLSRIYNIKSIFDKIIVGVIYVLVLVIILRLILFGKNKILFLAVLVFSIVYSFATMYNAKFLNKFFFGAIKLNELNTIIHFLIYIFCLTYMVDDNTENKKSLDIKTSQEI